MKAIIAKSLLESVSYSDYQKNIIELFAQGKSTGNVQSDDLTHYSELNISRMRRLDKTISIPAENLAILNGLKRNYIWLVISEGWCGDAAQLLPIFNKMAMLSSAIEMKIVYRDSNEELMNEFLTNGSKSIPKLIVLDAETFEVLGNFGPRPKEALALVRDYKEQFGIIDETIKTNLQLWYLHDKGLSTQQEILSLMVDSDR